MRTILIASVVLVIALLARCIKKWHYHRTLFRGLPQPPHSMFWGHLRVMEEVIRLGPPRAAAQILMLDLRKRYDLPEVFYLDLWPVDDSIMIVTNPDMFNQLTGRSKTYLKHSKVAKFMEHLGGRTSNLVSSEGAYWKRWRSAFNPGFSIGYLMTFVPSMVEDVVIFRDILLQKAKTGELFRLETPCTRLTVDIIGNVILDHKLNSQREDNPLVSAFESQVQWLEIGFMQNPSELIDIRRPFMFRKNTRIMNNYLSKLLEDRFVSMKGRGKQKHVIDLALETYLKEEKNQSLEQATELDPHFKRHALDHIKTFLFAGHDTTSSTISYCYHLLTRNPATLEKIRAEHDEVFGKDPNDAPAVISQNPHLINNLPYTMAVIKEVLRLYSPASTIREGNPNLSLHDPQTGKQYPTFKNSMIWPVSVSLHRSEDFWGPTAHDFIPERYVPCKPPHLPPPNPDPPNIPSNNPYPTPDDAALTAPSFLTTTPHESYAPFSKGPRNCIGQELALIEARIILALTIRSFDVHVAYDELSKLSGDGSGYPNDTAGEMFGDTAYQVQLGTAKPREGMPCRLRLRGV